MAREGTFYREHILLRTLEHEPAYRVMELGDIKQAQQASDPV
jgi:hypothetical protein